MIFRFDFFSFHLSSICWQYLWRQKKCLFVIVAVFSFEYFASNQFELEYVLDCEFRSSQSTKPNTTNIIIEINRKTHPHIFVFHFIRCFWVTYDPKYIRNFVKNFSTLSRKSSQSNWIYKTFQFYDINIIIVLQLSTGDHDLHCSWKFIAPIETKKSNFILVVSLLFFSSIAPFAWMCEVEIQDDWYPSQTGTVKPKKQTRRK